MCTNGKTQQREFANLIEMQECYTLNAICYLFFCLLLLLAVKCWQVNAFLHSSNLPSFQHSSIPFSFISKTFIFDR